MRTEDAECMMETAALSSESANCRNNAAKYLTEQSDCAFDQILKCKKSHDENFDRLKKVRIINKGQQKMLGDTICADKEALLRKYRRKECYSAYATFSECKNYCDVENKCSSVD